MKKKALAIITSALMLSACGGNGGENVTTSEAVTESMEKISEVTTTTTEVAATEEIAAEIPDTPYVLGESVTEKMISLSRLYEGNKVRLAEKLKKTESGEPLTVAFIGGSITQGSHASNNSNSYANLTAEWFKSRFQNSEITYVNAGIGATGSYIGAHRADTDLLSSDPDIVFIEFSVNDTTEHTERNINSYDSLIRKIWKHSSSPAIITIATTMEDGTSFQSEHFKVIKSYDVPMISYREAILHAIDKGYITWTDISDDNIHPIDTGHKIISELIASYIDDVMANLNSISGDESSLENSVATFIYENPTLIKIGDSRVSSLGVFTENVEHRGGFDDQWKCMVDGDGELDGLVIDVKNAASVGILYEKMVSRGGKFNVYVDDEFIKEINTDFTNGWGNYVECEELLTFSEAGDHTVRIAPIATAGEKQMIFISRIAVS